MSKQQFIIAASILAADFAHLGEEVSKAINAGVDWIHFDVMDNHYVPNLSFGPMVCNAIKPYCVNSRIDVHLMVTPVDGLIHAFAKAGANLIVFHPEASLHVDRSINLIKEYGLQAGVALNPATPLSVLDHIVDKVDVILLMSVNPGFGGQSFIPETLNKVRILRNKLDMLGSDTIIQVDGGINVENIAAIAKAGANAFVAGTAIFNTPDYQQTIQLMRQQLST